MKKWLILVMVVMVVFLLVGCGSPAKNYVGTWKAEAGIFSKTMVINSDGTGIVTGGLSGGAFTWENGDNCITVKGSWMRSVGTAKLSDDGNGLTFDDSKETIVFIRQGGN